MLRAVLYAILLLSSIFLEIKSYNVITDFSTSTVEAFEGDNVTFICEGVITSLLLFQPVTTSANQTTAKLVLIAKKEYGGRNVSCRTSYRKTLSNVALIILYGARMENNSIHNVTIGKQQRVILNYTAKPNPGNISVWKNGTEIFNYFIQRTSEEDGRILLNFEQVTSSDVGDYVIVTERPRMEYSIFVRGQTLMENSADPQPQDIRDIMIIVSPGVSFGICLVVIIVAIWFVKRKTSNLSTKKEHKQATKNTYVKSGEGKPAQPSNPTADAASRRRHSSSNQQPTSNSVAMKPPPSRSTSLHPRSTTKIQQQFSNPQFPMHNLARPLSTDSIDSFDNAEDEYENFEDGRIVPMANSRSFSAHMPPQKNMQQNRSATFCNPMMQHQQQQRPQAVTSPRPMVAPKPKKNFYQNQIFLRKHGIMSLSYDDDEEETVYEGMDY